jgi:Txe/YoeB family toxin of Txe-Axe toxin-antitoxin module
MKLSFTPPAWEDYLWFQEHDRKLLISDEHRLVYNATATEVTIIACRFHYQS